MHVKIVLTHSYNSHPSNYFSNASGFGVFQLQCFDSATCESQTLPCHESDPNGENFHPTRLSLFSTKFSVKPFRLLQFNPLHSVRLLPDSASRAQFRVLRILLTLLSLCHHSVFSLLSAIHLNTSSPYLDIKCLLFFSQVAQAHPPLIARRPMGYLPDPVRSRISTVNHDNPCHSQNSEMQYHPFDFCSKPTRHSHWTNIYAVKDHEREKKR